MSNQKPRPALLAEHPPERSEEIIPANGGWLKPFQKGQSGNPSGKGGGEYHVMLGILRAATVRAAQRMVELIESDDERVSFMAVKEVQDRVFGKPKEAPPDAGDPGAQERRAQLVAAVVELLSGKKPIAS